MTTQFDSLANFAQTTIATAPAPATSGTSLTLATGTGNLYFPASGKYNVVTWPGGQSQTAANTEVLRVTARAGDALTVVRAQEGTTARNIQANDNLALVVTAKTLSDIQAYAVAQNVLSPAYGAVADGVTDCTSAFQAAINAAGAGGLVVVPPGSYAFAGQLTIPSTSYGLRIACPGGAENGGAAAAAKLTYTGSASAFIIANSTYGIQLSGLQIEYTSAFSGNLIDLRNVGAGDTNFPHISDCYIGSQATANTATAVNLDKCNNAVIERTNFANNLTSIIGAASSGSYSNRNTIRNCHFVGGVNAPIQNAGQAWTIEDNDFEALTNGSAAAYLSTINQTIGPVFKGNWFGDATSNSGTWVSWRGSGLVFVGNYVGMATGITGLLFNSNSCFGIFVAGNQFDSGSGSGTGIAFGSTTSHRNVLLVANSYTGTGSVMSGNVPQNDISGAVNVRQFGAIGDGATDDTAAFTAALAVAGAASTTGASMSVDVPSGKFLTGPLTIPHRVTFRGAGVGATTLICKVGAAAGPFLSAASHAEMITIRDMRLQGNSLNVSQTNVIQGVQLGGSWTYSGGTDEYSDARHRLLNVHIEYFTGDGVVDTGTHHENVIAYVHTWQVKGNGFNLGNDDFVSNCSAADSQLDGFLIAGNALVANCKSWWNGWYNGTSFVTLSTTTTGNGFHITATSGATLSNCYAQDNGRAGFYFDGTFNGNYFGLIADSNNNNGSSTTFSGMDFAGFSGPLTVSGSCFDRGANTQHQGSAINLSSTGAPADCAIEVMATVDGTNMTAVFSAGTTNSNILANAIKVVDGTSSHGTTMYGNFGFNTNGMAGGSGVIAVANAATTPTSTPSGGIVKYAKSGFGKYRAADGQDYQDGLAVLVTTGTQNITATSFGTAPLITGLSSPVGANAYLLIGTIMFTGGQAAGTAVFGFTGPATSGAGLASMFTGPSGAAAPSNITLSSQPASPTLTSGGVFVWEFTGRVVFSGTGTLQVVAWEGTSGDTFTIQPGSSVLLIPLA